MSKPGLFTRLKLRWKEMLEEYGMDEEGSEWRRGAAPPERPAEAAGARRVRVAREREFLCKLRLSSYRRSRWLSARQMEADGPLSATVLKKFLKRMAEGEEVDPDYRTFFGPQRVIAHRNVCGFVEYMVKWHGLPYAEVRPDHWP